MRVKQLKQWLRSTLDQEGTTNLHLILDYLFSRHWSLRDLFSKDDNMRIDIVLCILLTIDQGKMVTQFQNNQLVDKYLPINYHYLREMLGERLAEDFNNAQWKFVPASFDIRSLKIKSQQVLPIHQKESVLKDRRGKPYQKGGTAELFTIEVLEDFVSEKLKSAIQRPPYSSEQDDLGLVSLLFNAETMLLACPGVL